MPTIKDLTVPRPETLEGNVQGIIDLHNVLSKQDEFEKDSNRVFQATYLTQAMKHTIQRVSENLVRTDQKRGTMGFTGGVHWLLYSIVIRRTGHSVGHEQELSEHRREE